MTKRQIKIVTITGAAAFVLWWFFGRKASAVPKQTTAVGPTGDVILGTPTVTGKSSTGDDYLTYPGMTKPDTPDWINPDGSPGYYLR